MQLLISGVHVDTGDAFRTHAQGSLDAFNEKHNIDPIEVHVSISKPVVYAFRVDITYRMGRGIVVHGYSEGEDPHFCFDNAMHMLGERIRRQKKRIVAHHKEGGIRPNPEAAYFVLSAVEPEEEAEGGLAPPVIAELKAEVPTLTVGEAVMKLDLGEQPAVMFYNESHGKLNMVYRRADGNIGWVDPA